MILSIVWEPVTYSFLSCFWWRYAFAISAFPKSWHHLSMSLSDDCSISSHSDASLSSSVYSKEEQYILSALSRSNPKTYGFIVFKENEAFGIGNVYRSFASVFLLAIVTNRTLFGICVSEYSWLADYSLYFVYFQPKIPVVLNINEDSTFVIRLII